MAPLSVIPAEAVVRLRMICGIQEGAWNVPLQWYDPNGGTRSVGSGVLAGLPGLLGHNLLRGERQRRLAASNASLQKLIFKGGVLWSSASR
jgi:hypothetical protein